MRIAGLALLALSIGLAGCADIPRSGPAENTLTEKRGDVEGFSLIPVDADNVLLYAVRARNDIAGVGGVPAAPRIRLSAGDVLRVRISESKEGGVFAPLALGGTNFENVRVDYRGAISLPYAGQISVAGLTPEGVQSRISKSLEKVAFEPQVYVELITDRGNTVLVSGEVKVPGRFSLLEGPLTLIDAVSRAGGINLAPHQIDVVIRRGKKVQRIPWSVVQSGHNVQLQPGDEIVLEHDPKAFNALGAVKQTGQVPFSKLDPTLLDALSQVGGLSDELAHSSGVFIFRLDEPKAWKDDAGQWHEGPAIFKFDMSRPEMMFFAQAFGIQPNDTIYVTNAPSVEWERKIRPIAIGLSAIKNGISLEKSVNGVRGF